MCTNKCIFLSEALIDFKNKKKSFVTLTVTIKEASCTDYILSAVLNVCFVGALRLVVTKFTRPGSSDQPFLVGFHRVSDSAAVMAEKPININLSRLSILRTEAEPWIHR